MDRWEPPAPPVDKIDATRRRWRARQTPSRQISAGDILIALLGRIGIAVALGLPLAVPLPVTGWVSLGLGVLAVICAGTVVAWRAGWPLWGRVWLVDAGILGCWAPVLVLANFIGIGGHRPLLPAEQGAYLQITVLAVVIWIGLTALAIRLAAPAYELSGFLLLPGACLVPGLAAVTGEFRNVSAAGVLVVVFLVGGIVAALVPLTSGSRQALAPLAMFVLFTMGAVGYAQDASVLVASHVPVAVVQPLLSIGVCIGLLAGFALAKGGAGALRQRMDPARPAESQHTSDTPPAPRGPDLDYRSAQEAEHQLSHRDHT